MAVARLACSLSFSHSGRSSPCCGRTGRSHPPHCSGAPRRARAWRSSPANREEFRLAHALKRIGNRIGPRRGAAVATSSCPLSQLRCRHCLGNFPCHRSKSAYLIEMTESHNSRKKKTNFESLQALGGIKWFFGRGRFLRWVGVSRHWRGLSAELLAVLFRHHSLSGAMVPYIRRCRPKITHDENTDGGGQTRILLPCIH